MAKKKPKPETRYVIDLEPVKVRVFLNATTGEATARVMYREKHNG